MKKIIAVLPVITIIVYPLLFSVVAQVRAEEILDPVPVESQTIQESQPIETIVEEPVQTIEDAEADWSDVHEAEIEREREIARQQRREERREERRRLAELASQETSTDTPTTDSSPDLSNTSLSNIGVNEDQNHEISLTDLTASNSNTGADSDNDASTGSDNSFDLGINNDFDANNDAYINVDSGHNSADKNTGDGEIVAGDADLVLTALNVGNNVGVGTQVFNVYDDQTGDLIINFDDVSGIPLGTTCGDADASNDTTGESSDNDASTTCTSQNTILIDNDGNIVNDYYLSADTGHNSTDKNTGDGSILTGDANVVLNVINFLNNTFLGGAGELLLGIVNIFGNLTGDIVLNMPTSGDEFFLSGGSAGASNSTTGADSSNNSSTNTNNTTDISLTNSSDILNNIKLFADTGDNDASKNTGSGSVLTGDVNSNLKVTNISNTNGIGDGGTLWLVLVNNLGTWTGQIWGFDSTGTASPFFSFTIGEDGSLNADTGANSTNNASTTNTSNTKVGVNNSANLTNNIYINANTGGNSASMNTGSGTIKTGDVNVAANIVNILNNNFIAGRLVITIVNVFGSFLGNIFPGGTGQKQEAITADENSSLSVESNGKVTTGDGGNNNATFNSSLGSYTGSSNDDSEASKEVAVSKETNLGASAKVDSVTKVIGKDAKSIVDFWWIVIPLLLASGSVAARRRLLWKVRRS